MEKRSISKQTIRRLPVYLRYLKEQTSQNVSATTIAGALDLSEVQVRKDLAAISDGGRPGIGYGTGALIGDLEHYLGYDQEVPAVLVGAGNLGRAILGYSGFAQCGLRICAAFDSDPNLAGKSIGQAKILSMDALDGVCKENGVQIGIITVPDYAAQGVCDRLVLQGVRAIWNFAPAHLSVPEGVILQNENLVASLTVLSKRLAERLSQNEKE